MKILSIESASLAASAALIEDDVLLAECTSNYKKTHSETLLPMIHEVMEMAGTKPEELSAIAVSSGPGSFTGLRIGAATAKGLAYALDIPVIPVPTLDAMAYGCFGSSFLLMPFMDARRNQVYAGIYEFEGDRFLVWKSSFAEDLGLAVEEAKKLSKETGKQILFLGDGITTLKDKLIALMPEGLMMAPVSQRFQRASSVGALAFQLYAQGNYERAETFLPVY